MLHNQELEQEVEDTHRKNVQLQDQVRELREELERQAGQLAM